MCNTCQLGCKQPIGTAIACPTYEGKRKEGETGNDTETQIKVITVNPCNEVIKLNQSDTVTAMRQLPIKLKDDLQMEIRIDEEFRKLCPSLSKEERMHLEDNLIREGCRDALVIWKRENILIDGHNRYEICSKHGIEFKTEEVELTDRGAVKAWIIINQLGRRNLTPEKFRYMIGKLYQERKKEPHRPEKLRQSDGVKETAEAIAEEYKISTRTVERAAIFAKAIDVIEKNLGKEVKEKILNRDIDVTNKEVIELAELHPEKQIIYFRRLKDDDGQTFRVKDTSKKTAAIVSSVRNEWYTPSKYIEAAREVMGEIDLDPATSKQANKTVRAKTWFTMKENGLQHEWPGRVWINPPHGKQTELFVSKLIEQYCKGITTEAVILVNSHETDTKWFQPLWDYVLCFADHRIDLIPSHVEVAIGSTYGSVFVYLGPNPQKFANVFNRFGVIVKRYVL